jgi:tRNA-dihydrouridine synthase B
MLLGKIKLQNNLILSPLLNITTAPYRRFCRHFGDVSLVSVPMLYSKWIAANPKSIESKLIKIEQEKPISVQIIGSDLESIKISIEYLNSYDFNVLDFNAGCPSRRAIQSKEGGYLLKDIDNLKKILFTMIKYSNKPVSLKIRTGFNKSENYLEIGRIAEELGLEYITIHGRTVKDRFFNKTLDYNTIKKLKESISIPVVGNGDIFNPISAKIMLNYTGVDAIMIGRGSIGNPQIFSAIESYLKSNRLVNSFNDKNTFRKKIEIYEKYIDDFLLDINYQYNDFKFIELKRNSIWLTKLMKGATELRKKLSKTKNLHELTLELENYFYN